MDGVIVIDKPEGVTSHDVVSKLRKIFKTKRVGHTGTLDPMATGVLVVCINNATKLVEQLTCEEKCYLVQMKFGIKTDTGDRTGKVIEEKNYDVTLEKINKVLSEMIGPQRQIPPMYSAIKINGKKLYEYAREGVEIERPARDIEIFDISDVEFEEDTLTFAVKCSKGTYIRSLCEDVAEKLDTVGTMTSLRRLKSGEFSMEEAVLIDDASEENIIGLEDMFENEVLIESINMKKLINGMEIYYDLPDGTYKLYAEEKNNKKFIGLGEILKKQLKRKIIL